MNISLVSVIFDILVSVAIVAMAIIGKRKGLLKMLFSLGIIFIAVFLARFLAPYVSSGLTLLQVDKKISGRIEAAVSDAVNENDETVTFENAVEKLKLPETVREKLREKGDAVIKSTGRVLCENITNGLTDIVMKLIGYVVLAVLVIIAIVAISLVLRVLTRLPLIGPIDSFGGFVVGALAGALLVIVVSVAVYAYGISHAGSFIGRIQQGSFFVNLVDKIGIIRGVIK